jgi:predicted amidohydrolase YtcJ
MISTLVLALLSAAQGPPEMPPVQASLPGAVDEVYVQSPGDMLVFGGGIYLGGADHGVADAILIRAGRVVETGDLATLEALCADLDPTRIDLRGAVAVPGFQLAEVHVLRLALDQEALDLSRAESRADVAEALAGEVLTDQGGAWCYGIGLDSELLRGELRAGSALGEQASERLVFLYDSGRDVGFLNRAALAALGWEGDLDHCSKTLLSQIELDEEHAPTGWIRGDAVELVRSRMEVTLSDAERDRLLLHAQDLLLRRGWTAVHDVEVSLETLAAYERLRDSGFLRLRVAAYLSGEGGVSPDHLRARDRVAGVEGRLSVPGMAFRLDRSLQSQQAALLTPYLGEERDNGRLLMSEESLTAAINDCYHGQLQPLVLAVGDRATRVAMRVFRTMLDVDEGFASCRPRVVGAEVVSTQDIPLFPGMKIYPTLRSGFEVEDVFRMEALLDSARLASAIEWNSIAPSLRNFAFQSELSEGVPDPLSTLRLAQTYERKSRLPGRLSQRGETLTGAAALRGLTLGPAAANHEDDLRGQLVEGSWADFTILSHDPFSPLAEGAAEPRALLVVIEGQVIQRP